MNNKASQRVSVEVITALMLLLPLLLLMNCSPREVDETARSGKMTLAFDRNLRDIATTEREMFIRYYPDTRITLMPSASGKSLKHLLAHEVRAALISGKPEAAEDSLFATLQPPLRREPVAHDAIVCIVNRLNPAGKLSLTELAPLFSGKESEAIPLVVADDYRLQSLFASGIGIKIKDLYARVCTTESELIKRVSSDKRAVGVLFRSSLDGTLAEEMAQNRIKVLPLSKDSFSSHPYLPTQQNIFEGLYPLVTTVYYVYYSGDPLAAGFGSWIGGRGQKAIERSSFAPYKPVERTIILKSLDSQQSKAQ